MDLRFQCLDIIFYNEIQCSTLYLKVKKLISEWLVINTMKQFGCKALISCAKVSPSISECRSMSRKNNPMFVE